ncbi:MAG: hypothetical protein HRU07_06690 [Nitrosopumilus sp.]|nr:hypothetical protein [Nitrosopumilus sp.]NRA05828.1 hypothetical protein [Nitrosopumilus sp.]
MKNLERWLGAPGLEFFNENGKRDHPPESKTETEAKEKQKPYIKTKIIDIGYDEQSGNFWEMSIVYDEKLYQNILDEVVKFVSPSIMRTKGKEIGPIRIADDYIPIHYAFVDEPAYGEQARVVGTCSRCTIAEAKEKLDPLIASLKDSPLQNTSFNSETDVINQMDNTDLEKQLKAANDENDKNKKIVDELKAEIDEIKKKNKNLQMKITTMMTTKTKKTKNKRQQTKKLKKRKKKNKNLQQLFKK